MKVKKKQGSSPKKKKSLDQGEGSEQSKGKGKRENQAQDDSSSPRKAIEKNDELNMALWSRLPAELLLEIRMFVVAACPVYKHNKCYNRCLVSTLATKQELKKEYESGKMIKEWHLLDIESKFACPVWGIGYLDKVDAEMELRHCECNMESELHTFLNKPCRVQIGQLTLVDEGVKLRRYRSRLFGAKVVIKNFGDPKYRKVKAKDEEDEDDYEIISVCYHDGSLREMFQDTCGKVTHCSGCFDKWFGLEDIEQYCCIDIEQDRACESCYEKAADAKERGECVF